MSDITDYPMLLEEIVARMEANERSRLRTQQRSIRKSQPMTPALKIEWRQDIPAGCVQLGERRTADMVTHFGRNIRAMRIETLAASCYLQGVEDCLSFIDRKREREHVDFQI